MIIPLKTFTGEFPRLRPHALPDVAAQLATDCEFRHGVLSGIKSGATVSAVPAAARSLFVHEPTGAAYFWTRDVDAVRSPLPSDVHSRFYWSDGVAFYVSQAAIGGSGEPSANNRWKVGVPRPEAAPSLMSRAFALPIDPASFRIVRADERMDGTIGNETQINSAIQSSEENGTSSTWTFIADAPAVGGGSVTVEDAAVVSAKPGTPDVYRFGQQMNVGSYGAPEYVDILVLNQTTATLLANGTLTNHVANPMFIVFDPKGANPKTVRGVFTRTFGKATVDNEYTFHRIGAGGWYSTDPAQTAKQIKKTTPIDVSSPFAGAIVLLHMVDATTKAEYVAKLREDAAFNEWPDALSSYVSTLTITPIGGGLATYRIVIAARPAALEARAYAYTYVNTWGEEGPPSEALFIEDCVENSVVQVGLSGPPSGFRPVEKARLYRTATGSNTDFQFVGEFDLAPGGSSVTDAVRKTELGEVLVTYNHYPPAQELRGLCVMSNGMLAGFMDNEIHLMEPGLPYACNPNAIKPLPHKIVGICPIEGGLFVTTTSAPYVLMGATPDTVTDARAAAVQAGVSKGAITRIGSAVAYASNDGIVIARGLEADLEASFRFFTRDTWRALYGDRLVDMRFDHHDGSLVVWFADGSPGFLMRVEEETPSMTRLSEAIVAAFVHPGEDALYVSSGGSVRSFGAGTAAQAFEWHSKDFVLPRPVNFGAVQVKGFGSVTLDVVADGIVRATVAATMTGGGAAFRLPGGFLANTWAVRVSGLPDAEVHGVALASSMAELAGV